MTMQAIVTGSVLAATLYVIVSKRYAEMDKKWAYGVVGTILGYWLG